MSGGSANLQIKIRNIKKTYFKAKRINKKEKYINKVNVKICQKSKHHK